MENRFAEIMTKRTNAELIEIIAKRDYYEPKAVVAAESVLEKRKLSPDEIDKAKAEMENKKKEIDVKTNAPLQRHLKIMNLLFPAILIFILAASFKADGFERRVKECWRWTFYGFGLYLAIFILIKIIIEFVLK